MPTEQIADAPMGGGCGVTALLAMTLSVSCALLWVSARGTTRSADDALVALSPPSQRSPSSPDTIPPALMPPSTLVVTSTDAPSPPNPVQPQSEEAQSPEESETNSSAVTMFVNGTSPSQFAVQCMNGLYPNFCHNRGSDHCQWRPNPCQFGDDVNLTSTLRRRTVVFRGDSTLRELFSMFSFFTCDPAPPVLKKDANWTFRTSHERMNSRTGFRTAFKFDYELHHLDEPLSWHDAAHAALQKFGEPSKAPPIKADAVVLALGMYNAKNFSKNASEVLYPLEDIPKYVPKILQNVCEQHGAKFGVFYAQTMECRAMSKNKAPTVKRNAAVCRPSWQALQGINAHVQNTLRLSLPNGSATTAPYVLVHMGSSNASTKIKRCPVYFIPSFRCYGAGFFCTHDGVHGRSHSNYIRTKVNILQNALKLLFAAHGGENRPTEAAVSDVVQD